MEDPTRPDTPAPGLEQLRAPVEGKGWVPPATEHDIEQVLLERRLDALIETRDRVVEHVGNLLADVRNLWHHVDGAFDEGHDDDSEHEVTRLLSEALAIIARESTDAVERYRSSLVQS